MTYSCLEHHITTMEHLNSVTSSTYDDEKLKALAHPDNPVAMMTYDPSTLNDIGVYSEKISKYALAVILYKESLKRGCDLGKVNLAICLLKGVGISKDAKNAVSLLEEVIRDKGSHYKFALYVLSQVFRDGIDDVQPDQQKYHDLLEKAADEGHTEATIEMLKVHTVDATTYKSHKVYINKLLNELVCLRNKNVETMCGPQYSELSKIIKTISVQIAIYEVDDGNHFALQIIERYCTEVRLATVYLAKMYMVGKFYKKNRSRAKELISEASRYNGCCNRGDKAWYDYSLYQCVFGTERENRSIHQEELVRLAHQGFRLARHYMLHPHLLVYQLNYFHWAIYKFTPTKRFAFVSHYAISIFGEDRHALWYQLAICYIAEYVFEDESTADLEQDLIPLLQKILEDVLYTEDPEYPDPFFEDMMKIVTEKKVKLMFEVGKTLATDVDNPASFLHTQQFLECASRLGHTGAREFLEEWRTSVPPLAKRIKSHPVE